MALAEGGNPGFLEATRAIRADDSWGVAPPAPGLVDRWVAMTGPTESRDVAGALFVETSLTDDCPDFLTLPASTRMP